MVSESYGFPVLLANLTSPSISIACIMTMAQLMFAIYVGENFGSYPKSQGFGSHSPKAYQRRMHSLMHCDVAALITTLSWRAL